MGILNGVFNPGPERQVQAFSKVELGSFLKGFKNFLSKRAANIDLGTSVSIKAGIYHIRFSLKNQNDLFKSFFKDGEFVVNPQVGGDGLVSVFLHYHHGDKVLIGGFKIKRTRDFGWEFEADSEGSE